MFKLIFSNARKQIFIIIVNHLTAFVTKKILGL